MYLSLQLSSMRFQKILRCWKLTHIKKFSFQHEREAKICEIKMLRNVVFRLNRKIKMSQNSEIVQKTAKLKCPENFLHYKQILLLMALI